MSAYDEELMELARYPQHRRETGVGKVLVNASCGDRLTVDLRVEDGVVKEGSWSGNGCVIAMAAAEAMVRELIGKNLTEVEGLKAKFQRMIYEEGETEGLGELAALANVARMPARGKCAMLAWGAVEGLE